MSGGKPVAMSAINLERMAISRSEDHRGEAASSQVRAGRRLSFRRRRASQWRMACSKVSAVARHLGQREGVSRLNQEGWAAR